MFHKDIITAVEKYAKEHEMTRREAWNDMGAVPFIRRKGYINSDLEDLSFYILG
jgi:hypothetical protein